VHLEGGWPDTDGIDGRSVGSVFGVNADAVGNRTMDVKQLFYEGILFSDNLTVMAGKIDFTGVFDTSAYADDECSQLEHCRGHTGRVSGTTLGRRQIQTVLRIIVTMSASISASTGCLPKKTMTLRTARASGLS